MTGPTINAERVIVHENYNDIKINNDIGLIILPKPIPEGINAKSLKILDEKDPKPCSTLTVSGWGITSTPVQDGHRALYLKIATIKVLERSISTDFWATSSPQHL
jgi:hypothetical protein